MVNIMVNGWFVLDTLRVALEPLWTVKARPDVLNMGTFSLRLRFGMWRLMFFWIILLFFYPWASDSWGWSESQGAGRFWLISVISPTYSVACWDMPMVPMWCMPGCSKLFRTQRSQQFFNRLLFGLCFHSPVDQKLGHVFRKKQRRFFMPSGRT